MRKRRGEREPERTRLTLLDRAVIPLVTVLVAFSASYLAAMIGSESTADNQRVAFEEQREKDDRDKRAEVYMAYLDAVGDYAPIFHAAVTCFRESAKSAGEFPQKCRDAMVADPKPLKQLKQSLNKLVVFGTPEVVGKVTRLHATILVLENQLNSATQPGGSFGDAQAPVAVGEPIVPPGQRMSAAAPTPAPRTAAESAAKFDKDYRDAYQDFVKSMCTDLSADPRTRCRS